MSTFNEANTIQAMLYAAAGEAGWMLAGNEEVPEAGNGGWPVAAEWLKEALLRLNKGKGLTGAQADEIVRQIQGIYAKVIAERSLLRNAGHIDVELVLQDLQNLFEHSLTPLNAK